MDGLAVLNRTLQSWALILLVGGGLLSLLASRFHRASDDGPPYSPEQALELFEIEDGFRVEPFAAEPLVSDPVAMEIDEEGRIYVVEMHGYPLDVKGSGKVKLLEDTDGDGRPDKSTVFAEGLILPNGILRWKNGVLVTDAPDVLYLEDTDGDGKADLRRVVLTGFARSNPQHNLNSPLYGLDNWIYLAHEPAVATLLFEDTFGDRGEEIHFPDRPGGPRLPVNADGRNVRFRPDTHELEALAARTQFGHTFDAWGHHLLVNNANHLFHEVIAARYLKRNPDLLVASAVDYPSDHGNAAEVFPITASPEHQLLTDVGVITSASGLTYYLGGAFPPAYESVTFVAEPVHNLVHTDRLEDQGATFVARRMQQAREFLASRDSWFRPVNFYIGPDGALYLIDYYRQVIEHPEWMSEEVSRSGALYNGTDRGRIWRIVPEEGLPLDWVGKLRLGQASTEVLVKALEQENIWYRRTAQRLLLDRRDPASACLLERLYRESALPEARLHALWTLEGLGRLTPELIAQALQDERAGVRENAIRLAELHLEEAPQLVDELVAMQEDAQGKVAYQLLLTLGEVETAAARRARERLLMEHIEEEWMQVAALSARGVDAGELFHLAVRELSGEEAEGRRAFFHRLGALIGSAGQIAEIGKVLNRSIGTGALWWRSASLEGLAEGLRSEALIRAALSKERRRLMDTFFDQEAPLRAASLEVLRGLGLPQGSARIVAQAVAVAQDRQKEAELRADAVRLIALSDAAGHEATLKELVNPQEPLPVQLAAVRALRQVEGAEVARFLLARWPVLTPQVRSEAVDVLLQEQDRIRLLLDALETGQVQPAVIGWGRTKRLMLNEDEALREKARALLSPDEGAEEEEEEEVVAQYAAALHREGDAARGEAVFARACAMCHQVGGEKGMAFGPDLATVRNRQAEFILMDILMPNRSIADGYEQWHVALKSGEQIAGVVGAETPNAITFRNAGGMEQTIARAEIASMEVVNVSAMPEGLRHQVSVGEMADLLAFLKHLH